MSGPIVSVILPVHRASQTIATALRSLGRQSLREFELIVVENESDAATQNILTSFARQDARIRIIQSRPADVALAFNAGLAVARAPFIARMDADDIATRKRLELQLARLQQKPDLGLVSGRARFLGDRRTAAGFFRYVEWQNSLLTHAEIAAARFIEAPIINPTVMLRRAVLERAGGYRAGPFPEDYDLWLRLLDEADFVAEKIEQTVLLWRDHASRLTRTHARYTERAFHKLKAQYLARSLRNAGVGEHRDLYLWGAGRLSQRYSRFLQEADASLTPRGYIDIDPRKIGRTRRGYPVFAPDVLAAYVSPGSQRPFVVSYVPGVTARQLIGERLHSLGYEVASDYYFAA